MTTPVVAVRNVEKRYGSTHALRDVSLTLDGGRVHGLIGPNGAGKSTLVKILAGIVHADAGEVLIDGESARIDTPQAAFAQRLTFVHQQLLVAHRMSVLDNVFLGLDTPARFGRVDKAAMRRRLRPVLERMGVDLPLDVSIEHLSVTQQRFAMIARALLVDARGIVLDEPTAALDQAEVELLFRVLRELRDQGLAILFISHRLGEVLELCDEVTVLRDGRTVATQRASTLTHADLLRLMGADEELPAPEGPAAADGRDELLVVRELTAPGLPGPISFTVRAGEIVGLAGVVGSGRSRLAKALVGVVPRSGGDVVVAGRTARGHDPAGRRNGAVLMPENRALHGISLRLKVHENVTLGVLSRVYRPLPFGTRRRAVERRLVGDLLERVGLDRARSDAETASLSGGMQQRVMFAKTLATRARVVILDEPTQGVDVATKHALHELIRGLAADGHALVVISSELEELTALCDRVLCLQEGRLTGELRAPGLTPSRIITALWEAHEAA